MNQSLILLLCKTRSNDIVDLENCLRKNDINFLTVCDFCTLDLDNKLSKLGFVNLTRCDYIKKPSAWDKAFYAISDEKLIDIYDYFFFIEEDVYSHTYNSLIKFIYECSSGFAVDLITKRIKPQSHYASWKYWKEKYVLDLKYPSQSFNPLCRLSKNLIQIILDYRMKHNTFQFHEILIPSLCLENELSHIDYLSDNILKKYIGRIEYNPILLKTDIENNLIYHPVKTSKNDRKK